jgi:hypothetical protein
MQQPIDRKTGYVLDPDRSFADSAQGLRDRVRVAWIGVQSRDHFDQPHPRDRREEMRAENMPAAFFAQSRSQ